MHTLSGMLEDNEQSWTKTLQGMAERFRGLRVQRKVEHKALCDETGLTSSAIKTLEGTGEPFGPKGPSIVAVMTLARYYGVSLDWLMGHADDETIIPAGYRIVDVVLCENIKRAKSKRALEGMYPDDVIKEGTLLYDIKVPANRKVFHPDDPKYLALERKVRAKLDALKWWKRMP